MAIENIGQDLFLRHTNTEGRAHVQQHRVWDKEKFLSTRKAEVDKMNAEAKAGEPRKARVDHITEAQYLKERSQ